MGVVEFLASLPLFRHLKPDALHRLAEQVRLVHFSDGHKIRDVTRDTAPVDGLYLIKSGVAKVANLRRVGKRRRCWRSSAREAVSVK